MTRHPITRRRFLGTGAALAGGLALGPAFGPRAAAAVPRAARQASPAAAQGRQFQGQLVVGIIQDPDEEAKQALSDAYRAQQPGVEIVWETRSWPPGEYAPWLGTQLAAGDIRLDLVSGNDAPTFRDYVNFDRYRSALNPYVGEPWDQVLNFDFFRGVNSLNERIFVATRSVHINWFYNQDLFAQASVEPPTTWTQFVDVCAKLKAAGITPVAAHQGFQISQWFTEVYFDQYHANWANTARAQPGDWNYNPDLDDAFVDDPTLPNLHNSYTYSPQRFWAGVRDGTLRFDTPAVAEIVRNLGQIFPKYATEDFFVIEDPYLPFLQQQAAIMPSGSWSLNDLREDLAALSPERLEELGIEPGSVQSFAWSTFENPPMEGPLVKSPVRSIESAVGEYLSIVDKNQEQTELAIDFLMFWLSPAGYGPYLDGQAADGQFEADGPLQVGGVQDPPEIQELWSNVGFLGNAEVAYNNVWLSPAGGSDTFARDLSTLYYDALQGEITPEEYATRLQAYLTDNLEAIIEAAGLLPADLDDPARQPGT